MYWLGWCWFGKKENELAKAQFEIKKLFPESAAARQLSRPLNRWSVKK